MRIITKRNIISFQFQNDPLLFIIIKDKKKGTPIRDVAIPIGNMPL
jgi:hypothetical protein